VEDEGSNVQCEWIVPMHLIVPMQLILLMPMQLILLMHPPALHRAQALSRAVLCWANYHGSWAVTCQAFGGYRACRECWDSMVVLFLPLHQTSRPLIGTQKPQLKQQWWLFHWDGDWLHVPCFLLKTQIVPSVPAANFLVLG